MTIRLATAPTVTDHVFGTIDALAAHIHTWRRDRSLMLRTAELYRGGGQEHAVSVYCGDQDGEQSDHLGYVITGQTSNILLDRLASALNLAQRPEAA